jgi:diguanylate cyclase (GGDEF)-like protein
MPRRHAWAIIGAGTVLAASADAMTGTQAWFGPVYLVLIGVAAMAIGGREAFALGLGYLALSLAINGAQVYPFGSAAIVWNIAMRVVAVTFIIGLLAGLRRSYTQQWLLARTDPLTRTLNRQAFFEIVPKVARSECWSLLAYADIDGFKALNDVHGHAAGDAVLKAFADDVRRTIRQGDLIARIGGDEFVIYLQTASEADAQAVARRLHLRMNAVSRTGGGAMRCSLGVLLLPPGPVALDTELRIADTLMYQAKSEGGALVVETAQWIDGALVVPAAPPPRAGAPFRLIARSGDRHAGRAA